MKLELEDILDYQNDQPFEQNISYSKQDKTKMLYKTILMFGYDVKDSG